MTQAYHFVSDKERDIYIIASGHLDDTAAHKVFDQYTRAEWKRPLDTLIHDIYQDTDAGQPCTVARIDSFNDLDTDDEHGPDTLTPDHARELLAAQLAAQAQRLL